jgi:imidazolonepropionase-like amidohydrolase
LTALHCGGTLTRQTAKAGAPFALRPGLALLPGRGLVEDVTVVVAGATISEVREGQAAGTLPPGLPEPLELPGCTLLPGLIDSHAHLSFDGGPDPVTSLTAASDVALGLRALHSAQTALARGVTTVVDCGDRHAVVLELRDAVSQGRVRGPRILASGSPITTTAGHCAWLGGCADSRDEVITQARRQVAAGADFLKVMMTGGNLTPGSNPHMLQYPAEVITALAAEARRLGRVLVAHAHSEQAVALAASAGVSIIAHGTCGSPGGISVSGATLDLLRHAGTFVDATITVGMALPGQTAPPSPARAAIRSAMLPVYAAMHQHGVTLLAGTDGGVTQVGHGNSGHAVLALHQEVGTRIDDALTAATALPAQAFGLAGVTGSIEPGLAADLLLLDGDVRKQPSLLLRPARVWQGGELVAADGGLLA